jgi:hypothetical protein
MASEESYTTCNDGHHIAAMVTEERVEEEKNLSEQQWDDINSQQVILKPFMLAQELLEGEKYVTISLIPAIIYHIRAELRKSGADPALSDHIRCICSELLTSFNNEWGSGDDSSIFMEHQQLGNRNRHKGLPLVTMLACRADPRTKHTRGLGGKVDRDAIDKVLQAKMLEVKRAHHLARPAAAVEPPAPVRQQGGGQQVDKFEGLFGEHLNPQPLPEEVHADHDTTLRILGVSWEARAKGACKAELELYLGDDVLPRVTINYDQTIHISKPLHWWKMNQRRFPTLAVLARKWLCISATSASSKRVFSHAGLTIAKDRAGLLPYNAAVLIFLHDTWPMVLAYAKAKRARAH